MWLFPESLAFVNIIYQSLILRVRWYSIDVRITGGNTMLCLSKSNASETSEASLSATSEWILLVTSERMTYLLYQSECLLVLVEDAHSECVVSVLCSISSYFLVVSISQCYFCFVCYFRFLYYFHFLCSESRYEMYLFVLFFGIYNYIILRH